MFRVRFRAGLMTAVLAATPATTAVGADARPTLRKPAAGVHAALIEAIPADHRTAVADILRSPTLTAKGTENAFVADPKVYDWLLDHPDRVSLAWQRRQIPCVDIVALPGGKFAWADRSGSELTWQPVARFSDGVVWLASGKVKPGSLVPTVPVKAVAVLHAPRQADESGKSTFRPTLQIYALTDSRAASALLRMAGPAAPRMAEQGAEQLLYYFSGIATYLHDHPKEIETLLAAPRK